MSTASEFGERPTVQPPSRLPLVVAPSPVALSAQRHACVCDPRGAGRIGGSPLKQITSVSPSPSMSPAATSVECVAGPAALLTNLAQSALRYRPNSQA